MFPGEPPAVLLGVWSLPAGPVLGPHALSLQTLWLVWRLGIIFLLPAPSPLSSSHVVPWAFKPVGQCIAQLVSSPLFPLFECFCSLNCNPTQFLLGAGQKRNLPG